MKVLNITDVFYKLRFNFKTQDLVIRVTGMKNPEKREVRSHNKVR